MQNLGLTGRVARASARRPWLTLGTWAIVLMAGVYLAGTIGDYVTSQQLNLVTTEANRADTLNEDYRVATDGVAGYEESVVVTSDVARYGDPVFDAAVADAESFLRGAVGVSEVTGPGDGAPVAANGASALITFRTPADDGILRDVAAGIDAQDHPGVDAFVFGTRSTTLAVEDLAGSELAQSERFGIVAALIILVFVFGAIVAAGLPLAMALVSIVTATGIGAIVARIVSSFDIPMSDSLTIFIAMLGLALGIDYSLLTVQRFREELVHGRSVIDAVTIAGGTANRAVLLSGATVVISLGGLLFIPLNTFLGIGVGVMAVAVASVASALFLTPAVLRLLGHRVNRLRVPTAHPGAESPRWRRIATRVTSRPAIAAVVGLGILAAIASPMLSFRLANPDPDSWPDDFVLHRANEAFVGDFGWTEATTVVAITGAAGAGDEILGLAAAIDGDPGFLGTTVDWRDDVVFLDTHDAFPTGSDESKASIDRLRTELIPNALGATDARANVGGTEAYSIDETRLMMAGSPWAVAFILGASFLLLLVAFRSIVIPLKAIALNLVGTLATFGVLVAVYQWGWGERLLGLPHVEGISPYMPVMVFALVFGLSMDYHVFLLSRIKERYDATGDNTRAVADGLTRTGPLITGAAIIMVAVFGGFAAASVPEISQWGFGLAAGVLIDATIIRALLVPAAMVWLGTANWYLPAWLGWLPRWNFEAPSAVASRKEDEREPALA